MPEGDTVFLTCRRLHAALAGRELVRGEIRHPRLATTELAHRRVDEVLPVGKHLLIRFACGRTLHHHLRMDGEWRLRPAGARWGVPTHQVRVVLGTAETSALGVRLHDLRWLPTAREADVIGHLGPDVLAADFDAAAAAARVAAEAARPIGEVLLDQRVLAGIGTLYQTEVCFLLGRAPWAPAWDVDAERAVHLSRSLMRDNLRRPGQSTTGSSQRGDEHWVYRRRTCRRCGAAVRRGALGAAEQERTTHYCPRCQRP